MAVKRARPKPHVLHHKDGTLWARGQTIDGVATGYWEWFRKDGTKLRSGHFENGEQTGEWTTYDRRGRVHKVTTFQAKPKRANPAAATGSAEVDRYLAALPDDQRRALEKLRKTIRAAAPRAEECTSYRLPAFRLDGKVLVCFGAATKHCAFYPGSGTAVAAHADELAGFATSKGAIRFTPDASLPAALVRKIVKYRIGENAS